MLPPTRADFLPHIARINYIAMCGKSYLVNSPILPPIKENGWTLNDEGSYIPLKSFFPPAPKAGLELRRCNCKSECKTERYTCLKMDFHAPL